MSDGHDLDHYDVAAVAEHLDLKNTVHIDPSTDGGEATYCATWIPTAVT